MDHDTPLEVVLGVSAAEKMEEMGGARRDLTERKKYPTTSDLCYFLPLANIQSLHVIHACELPADFWSEMLGRVDGLRYMKLSNGPMPDLSLLSSTARNPKKYPGRRRVRGPYPEHLFVPALEELEFHDITFVAAEGNDMSQKSLFSTLSTRYGHD